MIFRLQEKHFKFIDEYLEDGSLNIADDLCFIDIMCGNCELNNRYTNTCRIDDATEQLKERYPEQFI